MSLLRRRGAIAGARAAGGPVVSVAHAGTEWTTSSLTLDFPAATQAGDLIIAAAIIAINRSVTTPTGWTLEADTGSGSGSTSSRVYLFSKVYSSGDGADLTFATTSSAYSFSLSRFTDAGSVGDTATDIGDTVPDMTVAADGAMRVVCLGGTWDAVNYSMAAGYTLFAENTAGSHSFATAGKNYDAGSTGTAAFSRTGGSLVTRLAALIIEP